MFESAACVRSKVVMIGQSKVRQGILMKGAMIFMVRNWSLKSGRWALAVGAGRPATLRNWILHFQTTRGDLRCAEAGLRVKRKMEGMIRGLAD